MARPKVAEEATPYSKEMPTKTERRAVKADTKHPDATPTGGARRHRMAGSHDGMYVTEHHRGAKK